MLGWVERPCHSNEEYCYNYRWGCLFEYWIGGFLMEPSFSNLRRVLAMGNIWAKYSCSKSGNKHYTYISVLYKKKKDGKWSGMSREACSSSATTSAMLAEAVACVDTVGDGDRTVTGVGCGNWRCGSVRLQPNNPLSYSICTRIFHLQMKINPDTCRQWY